MGPFHHTIESLDQSFGAEIPCRAHDTNPRSFTAHITRELGASQDHFSPLTGSMLRNVEIKARIESVEALKPKAARIADKGPVEIFQDDTFFRCPSGRLKLRTFSDGSGELIYYRRVDERRPKESFYLVSQASTPAILRESLFSPYGESG